MNGIQVVFKEVLFDFFKVATGTFNATKTIHLDYTFIGETVQMVFLLKGNATMVSTFGRTFPFKNNECNIFFGTDTEGQVILEKGENAFFLIDIQKEFFIRNFPNEKFFLDINSKKAFHLFPKLLGPRYQFQKRYCIHYF